MSSNSEIQRRTAVGGTLELRDAEDGHGTLTGYGIVFNTPSVDLGGFKEVIAPGAVDLQTIRDVKFLVAHDDGQILGRTANKTLSLGVDERGVSFSLKLPNTTLARDTRELVRQKTVDAMSFGFRVIADRWSEDHRLRTVTGLELLELSAVSFPAYTATTVEAREVAQARERTRDLLKDFGRDREVRRRQDIAAAMAPFRRQMAFATFRTAFDPTTDVGK